MPHNQHFNNSTINDPLTVGYRSSESAGDVLPTSGSPHAVVELTLSLAFINQPKKLVPLRTRSGEGSWCTVMKFVHTVIGRCDDPGAVGCVLGQGRTVWLVGVLILTLERLFVLPLQH
jgi:hypothetical protein